MGSAPEPSGDSCLTCGRCSLRLFCAFDDPTLRAFNEMGGQMSLGGLAILFTEGEAATAIFGICSSRLKLSCTSKDGRTMILRVAGSGDVLGLSAVLGKLPYEVTAETIEPSRLKKVGLDDFSHFLADHP